MDTLSLSAWFVLCVEYSTSLSAIRGVVLDLLKFPLWVYISEVCFELLVPGVEGYRQRCEFAVSSESTKLGLRHCTDEWRDLPNVHGVEIPLIYRFHFGPTSACTDLVQRLDTDYRDSTYVLWDISVHPPKYTLCEICWPSRVKAAVVMIFE